MKNFTLEELDNLLRPFDCITGYDKEIDPINYYIFVKNDKILTRLHEIINDRRLAEPYEIGRIIKIVNLSKILSRKWVNDIFSRAVNRVIAGNDLNMLELVYILTQCSQDFHVSRQLKQKFSDSDDLYDILSKYIISYGYKLKYSSFTLGRKIFLKRYLQNHGHISLFEAIYLLLSTIKRKFFIRKQNNDSESYKMELLRKSHEKTCENFIHFIAEKFNLSGNYIILPSAGASGCTFIAAEIGGEKLFIKGNEFAAIYNSFTNEINAQKKLQTLNDEQKSLFVIMKDYDAAKKFIVYPYESGVTLNDYNNSGKKLNPSELAKLGDFLVKALDALYSLKITHRDLTPNNIIYDGHNFKIIDFGCAYSGGANLIGSNDYWDKVLKKNVCNQFRYDKYLVDDSASAYYVYIFCGGDSNDEYARKLQSFIGRSYM